MSTDSLPDALLAQLTTCQTAANEFLRQFWVAFYPPQASTSTPTQGSQQPQTHTQQQKAAKAAKMAGYLARTREKVDALARAAAQEGVEPARVEVVSAAPLPPPSPSLSPLGFLVSPEADGCGMDGRL